MEGGDYGESLERKWRVVATSTIETVIILEAGGEGLQ